MDEVFIYWNNLNIFHEAQRRLISRAVRWPEIALVGASTSDSRHCVGAD